jgi:hypothetical protein
MSVQDHGFLGSSNGHREVSSNSKTIVPQGCRPKAGRSFLASDHGLGFERCFSNSRCIESLQEITVAKDSEEPWFVLRHRFYSEHFGDLAF